MTPEQQAAPRSFAISNVSCRIRWLRPPPAHAPTSTRSGVWSPADPRWVWPPGGARLGPAWTPHVLTGFLDYLTARGTDVVTIESALGFATAPVGVSPRTQALRLSAIRGFARWAHTMDPTVQVPPAGLLPARSTRAVPYIYTDEEIAALLGAAGRLRPPVWAASFGVLLALM